MSPSRPRPGDRPRLVSERSALHEAQWQVCWSPVVSAPATSLAPWPGSEALGAAVEPRHCAPGRSATCHAELVAVRVRQLDTPSTPSARSCGAVAPRSREPVDLDADAAHGELEALSVPPPPRLHGRPAPGHLGPTGGGLDRGLLVLVPHERPAQRLGPEVPDPRVPSQASSPRSPVPARKAFSGSMTHSSLPSGSASTTCRSCGGWPTSGRGAESDGRLDRRLLPSRAVARHVQVHPVRSDLLRGRPGEPQTHLGVGPRDEDATGVRRRPSTRAGPPREGGHPGGSWASMARTRCRGCMSRR